MIDNHQFKKGLIMNTKAKPFIKWVGGKGQLIEQLEAKLPADFDNWDNATYRFVVTKDQGLWLR